MLEEYKLLNNELEKRNEELNKENERLKESEEYYKKGFVELHKRIEEAIEYIETHQLNFKKGTTTFGSERLSMEERKLIDILSGGDKE